MHSPREWLRLTTLPVVITRVLPFSFAVLFACQCAKRVLPMFEKRHPDCEQPREFIETAAAWAKARATDREFREQFGTLLEITSEIEREWDWSFDVDLHDAEMIAEMKKSASQIFAINALVALGQAITASSDPAASPDAGLSHIDALVDHCIEAELVEDPQTTPAHSIRWMNEMLTEFVKEVPLSG